MVFYNRRDIALTFARDRRAGTARRILEFAAQTKEEGTKSDILFWAPAPLRSVITSLATTLRSSSKFRAKKRFHIDQRKNIIRQEKDLHRQEEFAREDEEQVEKDDDDDDDNEEVKNARKKEKEAKEEKRKKEIEESITATENELHTMSPQQEAALLDDFVFIDSSDDDDDDEEFENENTDQENIIDDEYERKQRRLKRRQQRRTYSSNVEHQPLSMDIIMYILSFFNPTRDYDSLGWKKLPLPPTLSHPRLPPEQFTALLNHRAQQVSLLAVAAKTTKHHHQDHQDAALTVPTASLISSLAPSPPPPENLRPRLYRCSLYPPAEPSPKNFLIVRVLTPHRYVSNEELNMFLGRYGFVNSEPLSPDGFILSDAEAAAATQQAGGHHRAGTVRVLLFLVQLDSAQVAHRAIENCMVAQIDFLSWAVQVPFVEENYVALSRQSSSNSTINNTLLPLLLPPPSEAELERLEQFDLDPCVFPVSCLPVPEKLWLKPLIDVNGLVRRRRYLMLMNRSLADRQINDQGDAAGGAGQRGTNPDGTTNNNNNAANTLQNALDDGGLGDIRMIPEIIVDGLPYWVSDEQLLRRCSEFGTVKRIRFSCSDRTGAHYGCAAVTMSSVAEAVKLHDGLHGRVIDGETVVCGILEAFVENQDAENDDDGADGKNENGGSTRSIMDKENAASSSNGKNKDDGDDEKKRSSEGSVYYALVSLRTGELISWDG